MVRYYTACLIRNKRESREVRGKNTVWEPLRCLKLDTGRACCIIQRRNSIKTGNRNRDNIPTSFGLGHLYNHYCRSNLSRYIKVKRIKIKNHMQSI